MPLPLPPASPNKNARTLFRTVLTCLLALSVFPILSSGQAPAPATEPTAAPTSEPVAVERPAEPTVLSDAAAAPAQVVPAADPEAAKKDVLERIADSLSERTRALRKREKTLDVREEALTEREETLEFRVRAIMSRERSLDARENLIGRRERLPPPREWEGLEAPSIYGKYAAVIDAKTGQFFHFKDEHELTPVASTQKLLTALIVISNGNLDQELTVPDIVTEIEPTKIGVAPGQKYTRRELLRALLIRSGNDVAACLAIDNAGSIEAFAKKMNAFAVSIGAADSNFVNPHGLPSDDQVSSAHDMALIAFEAYREPFIRECVKTKTARFTFSTGTVRTLYNTNALLKTYELCNGMKTGFTYASGHCLVSSGRNPDNGDCERIVVVIGSNRTNVTKDSRALLEWALNLKMKDS